MRAHLAALPAGELTCKRSIFAALLRQSRARERMGSAPWDEAEMCRVSDLRNPRDVAAVKARFEFHQDSPPTMRAVALRDTLTNSESKREQFRILLRHKRRHPGNLELTDERMARAAGDVDPAEMGRVKKEPEFNPDMSSQAAQAARDALARARPEDLATDEDKYRTLLRHVRQDPAAAGLSSATLRHLADGIPEPRARRIRNEPEFHRPSADILDARRLLDEAVPFPRPDSLPGLLRVLKRHVLANPPHPPRWPLPDETLFKAVGIDAWKGRRIMAEAEFQAAPEPRLPADEPGLSTRDPSASSAPRQSMGPASPMVPAATHDPAAWNADAPEDWPIDMADAYASVLQQLQEGSEMQVRDTVDPSLLALIPVPGLALGEPLFPVAAEGSPMQPGPSQTQAASQTPAMRAHLAALPEDAPTDQQSLLIENEPEFRSGPAR